MQINTNNLVSITAANQNFSRVARLVDENGAAVILKNNVPRYVLMEFSQFQKEEIAGDEEFDLVTWRILAKNRQGLLCPDISSRKLDQCCIPFIWPPLPLLRQ